MATLVIAEHDNKSLNEATRAAVTAAKKIGGDIHTFSSPVRTRKALLTRPPRWTALPR